MWEPGEGRVLDIPLLFTINSLGALKGMFYPGSSCYLVG